VVAKIEARAKGSYGRRRCSAMATDPGGVACRPCILQHSDRAVHVGIEAHLAMPRCSRTQSLRTVGTRSPRKSTAMASAWFVRVESKKRRAACGPRGATRSRRRMPMQKVEAIIAPSKLDAVRDSLLARGISGLSVSEVLGHGHEPGRVAYYRGSPYDIDFHPSSSSRSSSATRMPSRPRT